MKNLLIVILLLTSSQIVYGQIYEHNNRAVVFFDDANVRESASLNSKVIATLHQGEELIVCNKQHSIDTINGVIASWVPVLTDGHSGYIWNNILASTTFVHSNGNRLLVKNDSKGLVYKVFAGDSLINRGTYPDKPYIQYSYFREIEPLSAIKENLYFKLSDSELQYSFDGVNVTKAGICEKENINSIHQVAQTKVRDSITSSIITGDNVNFRDAPNLNAKIIGSLTKYSFVKVIERNAKGEEIKEDYNYWYKINCKGKVGYVWGKSISAPQMHIYDNDDTNTTYLLCNNALLVLNKGEIKDSHVFEWEMLGRTIHSFGDLGFGKGYDFVAVETMAHSCGEWGGDTYYLWDGKKINYFCSDGGVGDGGLSDGNSYIFPSEQNGIPQKLINHSYSTELIDIIPFDDCEERYTDAIDYESYSILSYNGDTLVEAPSKYLELKQLIKREFPKYELSQYKFGDFNADSAKEDVIFQLRMAIPNQNPEEVDTKYKSKIGIAFNNGDGTFSISEINEHLIGENDDRRITINLIDSSIIITSYSGYIENQYADKKSGFARKIYKFNCNSKDKRIYWESVSTVDESGFNKLTFKTKKIQFKDAWSYIKKDGENYDEGYR